jgi:hypothetical protein
MRNVWVLTGEIAVSRGEATHLLTTRSDARQTPVAAKAREAERFSARSLDQIGETLSHKLVYIVVVAIVHAMDLAQPPVPACPLAIPDPTLGERSDLDPIGEKPVAEIEVLYLYLMLTCYAISDVRVLTRERETIR